MTFKETVSFLVQSLVRALGSAVNKGEGKGKRRMPQSRIIEIRNLLKRYRDIAH